MNKTIKRTLFLSLLLGLAACGSNSPTPDPNPDGGSLAAPQQVTVVPGDREATIVWTAVQDPEVVGYNLYQDDKKLNDTPITGQSVQTAGLKAQGTTPGELKYLVRNLVNGQRYKFRVVTVGKLREGQGRADQGKPLVCEKYEVRSTLYASRPYELHRAKLLSGAAPISSAAVQVMQGSTISSMTYNTAFNEYFDTSSGTAGLWAPGSVAQLLTRVGDCLVLASDVVPARPAITTPADHSTFNPANPLTVNWTLNYADPPRLNVHAAWTVAGVIGVRMFDDLPGSARTYTIPAGSIPANAENVRIWVRSSSPSSATFYGSYTASSDLDVNNASERVNLKIGTGSSTPPASSTGDPHLINFDRSAIEFQAGGEFDMAMGTDTLRVQARQQPWGGSTEVTVNTAIATRMNGQKAGIYIGSTPALRLGDTGVPTAVPAGGLNLGSGYRIEQTGSGYTFSYPTGERLVVNNNGAYLDAYLHLPDSRRGAMKGVWGNFDGTQGNDLFLRDGTPLAPVTHASFYGPYTNSWRIPSLSESLFVYDSGQTFGGFDSVPSAVPTPSADALEKGKKSCVEAGVSDPIVLRNCALDMALTGDDRFAQGAAKVPPPTGEIVVPPPTSTPKPDLTVTGFELALGDVCRPYNVFVKAKITVKNVGSAPSPARTDVGIVQAVDARDEGLGAGYRGNGVGLAALAAGASTTIEVPISYPISTPEDTLGVREYIARVNFGNFIDEASTANNRFPEVRRIEIPAGHCKNRVALIHLKDTAAANVYRDALHKKGLNVSLLDADTISSKQLNTYDLLMIDPLTGDMGAWNGTAEAVSAIGGSTQPKLGLGGGGYALFGKLKYTLGWGNGASGSTGITNFKASNPRHPVLQGPFPINIVGDIATVSHEGVRVVTYHSQFTSLERVGFLVGTQEFAHPVIEPKTNTAMWGFYGVPNYTEDGWNTVANLAWHLLR